MLEALALEAMSGRLGMPRRSVQVETGPPGRIFQHRPAAILAADVVGYSRLMEADEDGTHARLMHLRFDVIEPIVARYSGRVVKNTGDGFLAMFETAEQGLRAAKEAQSGVTAAEKGRPADKRLAFRMGLNAANVIVEDHDIYGDGVNIAARLQTHADPGGIVISSLVADQVGGTLGLHAVDLGQMYLRNREAPVRVLSLRLREADTEPIGEVTAGMDWRPSIAVLPFRKPATDDQAYFADGIVDNIVQALSGLRELTVIARTSTLSFGGEAPDVRAIGRLLGIRYLLSGSVQRSGDRLRIGTELIEAETATVLRADHHDGQLSDLFALQDRIAEETVKLIAPRVRQREMSRIMKKHPQNMSAYDFYLQALDPLYRLDYASFSRARGLLQRAMVIDPTFTPAFALAARWHSLRIGQGWSPDVLADSKEAERLAAIAIGLDDNDALAWAVRGHQQSFLTKDFDLAMGSFAKALSASPNLALAWTYSAATACFVGDGPDAVRRAKMGLRLSPLDAHLFFAEHILSQAHYVNGNADEAVSWAVKSMHRNDSLTSNLRILAAGLADRGKLDQARRVAGRHAEVDPGFSLLTWSSRTPLNGPILAQILERLAEVGFPA